MVEDTCLLCKMLCEFAKDCDMCIIYIWSAWMKLASALVSTSLIQLCSIVCAEALKHKPFIEDINAKINSYSKEFGDYGVGLM